MSNWSHVTGIIRINNIRPLMPKPDFENIFGKEISFEDKHEIWEDAEKNPSRYMPMGSEGSLKMLVWENPKENDLFSYVISIFGDLRDHDNSEEIIEWFKDKVLNEGLFIRQATITVSNEINGTLDWTYERDDKV